MLSKDIYKNIQYMSHVMLYCPLYFYEHDELYFGNYHLDEEGVITFTILCQFFHI